MKRLLRVALTVSLTALTLSACAPYVRSDVNTAAISHVHCGTFAWAGEFRSSSPLRSTIANPVNESRLRAAIASHLGVACPLCQGKGVVPRGVHDHFAPLIPRISAHNCDGCGHGASLGIRLERAPWPNGRRRSIAPVLAGAVCRRCFLAP